MDGTQRAGLGPSEKSSSRLFRIGWEGRACACVPVCVDSHECVRASAHVFMWACMHVHVHPCVLGLETTEITKAPPGPALGTWSGHPGPPPRSLRNMPPDSSTLAEGGGGCQARPHGSSGCASGC